MPNPSQPAAVTSQVEPQGPSAVTRAPANGLLGWLFSWLFPSPPAPLPTPVPPSSLGVYALINQRRAEYQLPALGKNPALVRAAEKHVQWMLANNRLDHYEGSLTWFERARAEGFAGSYVGEIIAFGQTNPSEVVADWMSSSGHRAEILGNRSQCFGFGRAGNYWCVVFGGS